MLKTVQSSTLRNQMAHALREVGARRKFMLVTRNGKPVSVLVNLDFFEDLLAANSPRYVKSIREARQDYRKGRVFSHDQVFGVL